MGVLVAPVSPSFLCQSGGSDHLPPSWADHLPISCILLVHLSPFPMPICLLPIAAIPPTLWSCSPGIHRGPSVFWLLAFCSVCTTGQDKLASSLDLFLPASSVSHEVTATKAFPLASAELSDFFSIPLPSATPFAHSLLLRLVLYCPNPYPLVRFIF